MSNIAILLHVINLLLFKHSHNCPLKRTNRSLNQLKYSLLQEILMVRRFEFVTMPSIRITAIFKVNITLSKNNIILLLKGYLNNI